MEEPRRTIISWKLFPEPAGIIDADLVLLALGFVHPVLDGLLSELDLELDQRKKYQG